MNVRTLMVKDSLAKAKAIYILKELQKDIKEICNVKKFN